MSRRGENIFKRKDGRWEGRYVKEVNLDGSKKYGSVYAKTYHEVKVKQLARINQPLSCTRKSASTVVDIMWEWLEQNKNQLKISSYQRYCVTIQNHISNQLGKIQIKHGGKLQKIKFKYSGVDVDTVLDRLPTAKILDEDNGEYTISAEVFGKGIEMWIRSQGDMVSLL